MCCQPFFSITVSFFTELPIQYRRGCHYLSSSITATGIQGHVAIITRLRIYGSIGTSRQPENATVTVMVASFVFPALSVARARIVVLPAVVTTSEADQVDQSALPPPGPVAVASLNGFEPTFTSTF